MSRVGKQPVPIPSGVTVSAVSGNVEVKGSKGTLNIKIKDPISVKVDDNKVLVERPDDTRTSKSLHGLTRTLIANMIEGVSKGYDKKLLLTGVGYRATLKGKGLSIALGYSHPVTLEPPDGISFEVSKSQTEIVVRGIDKAVVGQVAANIREFKKTEPYKGKGIKYENEFIRRKAGKTAVSGGK